MSQTLTEGEVLEGSDFWIAMAIAVDRAVFTSPVLLTQGDISGSITLNVYGPYSSAAIYTTTFLKTSSQDGGVTQAIHAALVDSRWEGEDAIGHNFVYQVRQADLPGLLKGGKTYTFDFSIPTLQDGNVPAIARVSIKPRH